MSDQDESISKYLDLAEEHLDDISKNELLVLKFHLIVETALRDLIASSVRHPEFLDVANLRFFQVLNIAKAMFFSVPAHKKDSKENLDVWDALEALNTLRNRLAHRLDQDDLVPLLRRIFVLSTYKNEKLDDPAVTNFINMSCGFLTGFIASLGIANLPTSDNNG